MGQKANCLPILDMYLLMPLKTAMPSNDHPGAERGPRLPQPDANCLKVRVNEKIDWALSRINKPITKSFLALTHYLLC